MMSGVPWLFLSVIVAVLLYAVLSVYLKKSIGLYIAAAFHMMLGIISLPSIGLYVLGLALLEIIAGVVMTVKLRRKRAR